MTTRIIRVENIVPMRTVVNADLIFDRAFANVAHVLVLRDGRRFDIFPISRGVRTNRFGIQGPRAEMQHLRGKTATLHAIQ